MTNEELEELTRRYLAATFDAIEDRLALDWNCPVGRDEHSSNLNAHCHELSEALASADLSPAIELAQQSAPAASEAAQRKLARRMMEIQLRANMAEMKAMSGWPLERPQDLGERIVGDPKGQPTASPKVSEIALMYTEERVAQGRWSPKTAEQGRKIFQLIANLLGDPQIGEVSKADVRQLGLDITRLPANMTKKYPGMSAAEVLTLTPDDDTLARLEPRSVNKHYQHVRTLFAWAAEHDYVTQSPATILRDVEEGRAQDARKAFDDADITALFAELSRQAKEPYGLWIPRIMAFTGCRMGEAAQLRKADVRLEQDTWVFDFNKESDQKNLKTDGSVRLVPVHPRLIELGMLNFAQACTDDFLFPARVRYTENEKRGNVDRLSKELNRWLRSAGIDDRRKTFQSFRGTLATRLKDLGIPEYQIAEIMGHENDNITSGRYGKRSNLKTLRDIIARLELPI